jgi:hypothetical protein
MDGRFTWDRCRYRVCLEATLVASFQSFMLDLTALGQACRVDNVRFPMRGDLALYSDRTCAYRFAFQSIVRELMSS